MPTERQQQPERPRTNVTIDEFCQEHRISRATFYNLRDRGDAPRLLRIGKRVLITRNAIEEWRIAHESEAAA